MKQLILITLPLFLLLNISLLGQQKITWQTLSDVEKIDQKVEDDADLTYQQPIFGVDLMMLQDQEVEITGFVFPMDLVGNYYILSKFPYNACFFCGNKDAGAETVLELKPKKKYPWLQMDDIVTFRGRLTLNDSDINQLYYILKDAEIVGH